MATSTPLCAQRSTRSRILFFLFPVLAQLALVPTTYAQALNQDLWVVDGTVDALAASDSVLYLGGTFTRVGPATGSWVGIRASTGDLLSPYPLVAGTVNACVPDGQGGWIIGGFFSAVGGIPRANLARFDAAGNLTDWNPGTDQDVYALAVQDTSVYLGGYFSLVNGQARNYLAAVSLGTGAVTSWNPGADGSVNTLCFAGGLLYAGGEFTHIGGHARNYIAQLGTDGSVGNWNPSPNSFVWSITQRRLTALRNVIYFGGAFTMCGSTPRNYAAAQDDNPLGTLSTWNPAPDATVFGLKAVGSTIYAHGGFQHIGGQTRAYLAALDPTGAATAWNPAPDDYVSDLVASGSNIFVGGQFHSIGGSPHTYLASVDNVNGVANPTWDPRPNLPPKALGVSGDTLYVGGYLTSVGGVDRQNLAALDLTTGVATAWNPGASQTVNAMALSGGKLYLGGGFLSVAGQPRKFLAAVDATTGALTGWDPNAGNGVLALAIDGPTVYAGGVFTSMGDLGRLHIAAIDASSGAVLGWNPSADQAVEALAVYHQQVFPFNVTVYAGGQFSFIGGQTRLNAAAIDGSSGLATSWNPSPDGGVEGLMVVNRFGKLVIYLAGCFAHVDSMARNRLASVNALGQLNAWDPNASGCASLLALGSGLVYVGGGFGAISGQERWYSAAVDPTTGAPTSWIANADAYAHAFATVGSSLFIGGEFRRIADFPHSGIAMLSEAATAVDGSPSVAESPVLMAAPNPFQRDVAMRFTLPAGTEVETAIFDVSGRRVREISSGWLAAGEHVLTWNGHDSEGRPVRAGIYFARVRAGSTHMTTKILRL